MDVLILKIRMTLNEGGVCYAYLEKGEYQLLYRNVEENDVDVIKQNLLYIANNMK